MFKVPRIFSARPEADRLHGSTYFPGGMKTQGNEVKIQSNLGLQVLRVFFQRLEHQLSHLFAEWLV